MKKLLFICIALVLGIASVAQATPLPEGSMSLGELIRGQGSITANDKIFDRFTFFDGFDYGNLANVLVSPLTNDPLNPGLRYMANGEWSVIDFGGFMYLEFGFRVRTTNGLFLIKDNSLEIVATTHTGQDPTTGGDGGVILIEETVYEHTPPDPTQIAYKYVRSRRVSTTKLDLG